MPTLPWQQTATSTYDGKYVVMLSYLPLSHYRDTLRFYKYVQQINGQLRRTEGLLGYSFKAHIWQKDYWTLSVWEDQKALDAFIRTEPHVSVMKSMSGAMGQTKFTSWQVEGSELPVIWAEALGRQKLS